MVNKFAKYRHDLTLPINQKMIFHYNRIIILEVLILEHFTKKPLINISPSIHNGYELFVVVK